MKKLLDQPYSLRQFIVVEKDEIIAVKLKAEEEILKFELEEVKEDKTEAKQDKLLKKSVETAILVVGFGVWGQVAELGFAIIDTVIKSIKKQRELTKRINVNYISFTDALDFKFPFGHPREYELYVAHPTLGGTYYPINEFHKKVFEHKFAELISVLVNLGAKKINVEYISGWDFNTINQLEVEKKGGMKLKLKSLKDRNIIYHAEYRNNESLKLPSILAWYYHEPTWQSVGEGRLDHDLQNFNLILEYNDDFGIDLDLFAEIQKIGFGSKNSFKKKESTVWKIMGEF